ncbi:MAG: hypothetical protein R6V12_15000 [Candidatus Hydrogenedentota bacterium]
MVSDQAALATEGLQSGNGGRVVLPVIQITADGHIRALIMMTGEGAGPTLLLIITLLRHGL